MHEHVSTRSALLSVVLLGTVGAVAPACQSVDSSDDDGGGAVSKRIGPEGGTLETRGMRLEVPPGALASEVELTVSTSSETPRGYDAVSSVYRFGPPG
jgi:hypothetical protein